MSGKKFDTGYVMAQASIWNLGLKDGTKVEKFTNDLLMKREDVYGNSLDLSSLVANLDESSLVMLISFLYSEMYNHLGLDHAHLGHKGAVRLSALLLAYDYYVVINDHLDDDFAGMLHDALTHAFNGAALKNLEPKIEGLFTTTVLKEVDWYKLLVNLQDKMSTFTLEVFEFSKPNNENDKERYNKFWVNQLG